jgi:hypothetical protein
VTTLPEQPPAPPEPAVPVCVACLGDRADADGGLCKRCRGTGRDPDPMAPAGIVPLPRAAS